MKSFRHVNIDFENSVHLAFNDVNAYNIKESNEDKELIFGFIDKSKEVLEKYTKLWKEIKNQIETINVPEPIKYKRDFMKIRFESDDD